MFLAMSSYREFNYFIHIKITNIIIREKIISSLMYVKKTTNFFSHLKLYSDQLFNTLRYDLYNTNVKLWIPRFRPCRPWAPHGSPGFRPWALHFCKFYWFMLQLIVFILSILTCGCRDRIVVGFTYAISACHH